MIHCDELIKGVQRYPLHTTIFETLKWTQNTIPLLGIIYDIREGGMWHALCYTPRTAGADPGREGGGGRGSGPSPNFSLFSNTNCPE